MNRAIKYLLVVAAALLATTSQAELFRVGPTDIPSPTGNGYPLWYQDTSGLALDLCVPQSLNQLDVCLATPAPGDPLPALPYSFPTNWPDEFFWFGADGLLDLGGGNRALVVQAVEAAFGIGPAAVGDQIVFARTRIMFDAPVDGDYTVTFPYGEKFFPNVKQGKRAVFFTSDIGIGAAGDFSGALKGDIGPFLTAVTRDTAGNETAKPFFMIDGDTFLSDPLTETQVTGSPFGSNFFKICVAAPANFGVSGGIPIQCIETDTFALIGKVHTGPIASALNVTRATYARDTVNANAQIDVFASAEPVPFAAAPDLTVGAVGMSSVHMVGPQAPGGQHYAQGLINKTQLPATVSVINSADTPGTANVQALVDAITILDATYDPATQVLSVTAISSDTFAPPQLAAQGIPGSLTGSDVLVNGSTTVTVAGGVPPKTVTVVSSAGGSATQAISVLAAGGFLSGAPLAVNDTFTASEGVAGSFNILANDGAEAVASTLNLVTTPVHGLLSGIVGGTMTYTPAAGYFGSDSFMYTVSSIGGLSSNTATVTIDVQQFNDAPVANDDTVEVLGLAGSVAVNVAANDTDADGIAPAPGGLDPLSAAPFGEIGGTITKNADGTVTFAKDINNCSLGCSFQYTVTDIATASSTAINTSNAATVMITNVLSNTPPTANADAASVIANGSVTIDVAANDTNGTGTIQPGTVVIVAQPAIGDGTAASNGDGTVTYTAPALAGGPYSFSYTIADDLGEVSAAGIVSITVNPAPDILGVQRSQCRTGKNEWRVDGDSSLKVAHSVTIYAGPTVAGGTFITTVPVDNFGAWRISKNNTSAPCSSIISIESSLGGRLENVFIPVN